MVHLCCLCQVTVSFHKLVLLLICKIHADVTFFISFWSFDNPSFAYQVSQLMKQFACASGFRETVNINHYQAHIFHTSQQSRNNISVVFQFPQLSNTCNQRWEKKSKSNIISYSNINHCKSTGLKKRLFRIKFLSSDRI